MAEDRGGRFKRERGEEKRPIYREDWISAFPSLILSCVSRARAGESFFMSGSVNIAHTLRDIHHATMDSVSLNGGAARLVCVG